MNWLVIKNEIVINIVVGDDDEPNPNEDHDLVLKDELCMIAIGDKYNEKEDMFYRPINIKSES